MEFEGKVALVTGAASGIGRASALGFAGLGARVVVSDISRQRGEAVAAEICAGGGQAVFEHADATREEDVARLLQQTKSAFGRLDFAHNNVGFSRGAAVEDITLEEWEFTVDLCLKAPWLGLKYQLPVMAAQGGGAIVNTASMAGVKYSATANIAYSAAKAGVIHMTRYAAVAYATKNIRVNAVSPGLVKTAAIDSFIPPEQQDAFAAKSQPIGRIIQPEEIADAVIFLCSSKAAMITGENIRVAGGHQAA